MTKFLLTGLVVFVATQITLGQHLSFSDNLSPTHSHSLSFGLNKKAFEQKIRCGGANIVNLHFFNERDTLIHGQACKIINITFETEYVKFGLNRKPNGIVESSYGYLLFKKDLENGWVVSEVFHKSYKEYYRFREKQVLSKKNDHITIKAKVYKQR